MTLEDLKSKLDGGIETQTFEVKDACDWNVISLAKDILAMANVQDGGVIVIGIEDGTFACNGVNTTQRDSYNLDIMKDQMAPYADPNINFKVEVIADTEDSKEYVAITVFPFEDVPTICKREGGTPISVHAGTIYYRNKTGRVQSGSVSNSYDMRDIITVATVKMMQKLKKAGVTVEDTIDPLVEIKTNLNSELEGL